MISIGVSNRVSPATARQVFGKLRGTLGQTMLTAIVVQVGLFVTGPLVARMLGVEDRGHLAALTLWPTNIATIAIWGVPTALTFERAANGPLRQTLVRGITRVAVIQSVIAVLVHIAVLLIWLSNDWGAMRLAAIASLFLGPAFIARDYGMAALQGARDFRWFNAARLSQLVVYIPLVVILFLANWGGLTRQVLASVIAAIAMAGIAIGAAYRKRGEPTGTDPGTTVRSMLQFGQRSHFGRLMPVERFRADQLAVTLFLTPAALGLYAVATAFTNVLRFLTMAIGYVAFPAVAAETDPIRARATALRYVRIAIVISIVMVGILEIVGPWLIGILYGAEFRDAGRPLQWLLPGVGIVGIRRVLAESMRGGGNEAATSKAEVVTSIVFLALVYPLLRLWDLNGVAISITVAEAAGLVMLAWLLNRPNRAPGLDTSGGHA